jgi:hypothetical protein
MALAYDCWVAHVQATVPTEQLLIFPATDGWKKEEIDQGCQEVLQSGEAYPYVNDATSF